MPQRIQWPTHHPRPPEINKRHSTTGFGLENTFQGVSAEPGESKVVQEQKESLPSGSSSPTQAARRPRSGGAPRQPHHPRETPHVSRCSLRQNSKHTLHQALTPTLLPACCFPGPTLPNAQAHTTERGHSGFCLPLAMPPQSHSNPIKPGENSALFLLHSEPHFISRVPIHCQPASEWICK